MTPEQRAKHAAYMRDWVKRAPKDSLRRKALREDQWHRDNLEKTKEAKRKYWEKNRERINAERRGNPAKLAQIKEYRQTSMGKASKKRVKAIGRGAVVSTLTAREWREILAKYNGSCAYCKSEVAPVEQEHKIPLSRGGEHTKENVVPACRRCNMTKGTRTLDEWAEDIISGKSS